MEFKDFIERWGRENGEYGIEKVIQGSRTESVPLGELKKLSHKIRYDQKIDAVAAMMDAYVAWKLNREMFE